MHITDFTKLSRSKSLEWRKALVAQEILHTMNRLFPVFVFVCTGCDRVDVRLGAETTNETIRRTKGIDGAGILFRVLVPGL